VDVASYGMMRKKIEANQMRLKSIRLEEMINYFTYDLCQPCRRKTIFCSTKWANAPGIQNTVSACSIQGKRMDKSALPPSNLVFLIDVSGSMMQADKFRW